MEHDALLDDILNRELTPATGCTEVCAVALASAWAVRALGVGLERVDAVQIEVDNNTYKNAVGVGIPGTGQIGLWFAGAMGAVLSGESRRGLQILHNPGPEAIELARRLIASERVGISRLDNTNGDIVIRAVARAAGAAEGTAEIRGNHDRVTRVARNGVPMPGAKTVSDRPHSPRSKIKDLCIGDLAVFARGADLDRLPVVREAMRMNTAFCDAAMNGRYALKMGGSGNSGGGIDADCWTKVQFTTALAVQARMTGLDLPVMTCAGSGNQGLVSTIPVAEFGRSIGASEESILRALILSYLVTIYVKAFTGVLSPICGCGIASGVGAGCGIIQLRGGNAPQIEAQISNMIGAMAGIICDGAKSGCAVKALMAVGLAVDSSFLSMKNSRIPSGDGIMAGDVRETLSNLENIIENGMGSMDSAIIQIMDRHGVSNERQVGKTPFEAPSERTGT